LTEIESNKAIEFGLTASDSDRNIARRVFLGFPTHAFEGNEERQYQIVNRISEHFGIPYTAIQVTGSAKTGYSYFKRKSFDPLTSDLDIAVIDKDLFLRYMELSLKVSDGYKKREMFTVRTGVSNFDQYTQNLAKGFFRPDLMPSCPQKAKWKTFFGNLSKENRDLFKSINGGVYLSQLFFEFKQAPIISKYKSGIHMP
jgi:hypothetical protein